MSTIKHIVFDIGMVLIHWDPDILYRRLIPDAENRRWFLTEVCSGAWNVEQDLGRDWTEAEDLLIRQHPKEASLIRAYRTNWIEMVPHALEGTVAIMKTLIDAGKDVTLLTNFNQDTFKEALAKYPFLDLPRGRTVSGELGIIKPDRAIFDHHVSEFDLEPATTLFFDDSEKNVQGAHAAGWQAELFTDAEKMQQDLAHHGVISG